MKKTIIVLSLVLIINLLSACGWRENLLAPPDEYIVPEGSKVAECTKDDDVHKYIYKDDGVYLYYINDEEQDEDSLDHILEQAFLHGSSVEAYLSVEYSSTCLITEYIPPVE